jgi:hypothetical protein
MFVCVVTQVSPCGPDPGEESPTWGKFDGAEDGADYALVNAALAKLTGFGALGETMEVDGHGNFDVHFSYLVLKA